MPEMSAIDIHPISIEDLAHVQRVHAASSTLFRDTGLIATPDGMPTPIPDFYLAAAADLQLLFGAFSGDTLVGFALCSVERPDLFLEQISVTPAYGRRGIGRALLQAVHDEARRRGLFGVVLSTFRDIPWNGPFYAKNGFVEIPQVGLALWQLDIANHQAETMDRSRRCFMRRRVDQMPCFQQAA